MPTIAASTASSCQPYEGEPQKDAAPFIFLGRLVIYAEVFVTRTLPPHR